MRPALQALAEQQRKIDQQDRTIRSQATVIDQLKAVAGRQRNQLAAQAAASSRLERGLAYIAQAAGIGDQVRTAMLKRADEQNPAQPIPEPPAEPPVQTTPEANTPEAFGDPLAPGMVPGSTNDVAADTTTTNYTPGADIPAAPVKDLVDVTRPVDGTQGPRPLNEVRTLTDVRVGNPMNPAPAFPLRGDFANAQRLGSKDQGDIAAQASNRTMASLRLAKMRIQSGIAMHASEFEEAATIEKDASMTNDRIEGEIETLGKTAKVAQRDTKGRPAGLVPRAAAGGHRTTPSMQATAGSGSAPSSTNVVVDDADLFD